MLIQEHPVVGVVKSKLGQAYRPRMQPPATLEFLKFTSPAAGRFEVPGDDPDSAPMDWADEEELAIRAELRARKPAPADRAAKVPGAPVPAIDVPAGEQAHQHTEAPVRGASGAPPAGVTIPGLPTQSLPDPPRIDGKAPPGRTGDGHPAPAPGQPVPPRQEHVRATGHAGHARPEHGLGAHQSLLPPAPLVPPSGSCSVTPPWVASRDGPPPHHLPHLAPQHAPPMAPTPMTHHTLPPPAAPYEDMAVYGGSEEYMPPLPSEPYDGDGSAPPPLPDEPPPLPDEPYEAAFPDSQV